MNLENSDFFHAAEPFILGLHIAVSNNPEIEHPSPEMHVYLSGILERKFDPAYQRFAKSYLTENPLEFFKQMSLFSPEGVRYLKRTTGVLPNHIRYFFARVNAEDKTIRAALEDIGQEEIGFAAKLYETARFYRQRYAQHSSETEVLSEMAENLPYCIDVLSAYFQEFGEEGNSPVFDEQEINDFYSFFLKDSERWKIDQKFLEIIKGIF